jgi:phosphatidylinositol-3-phosphatase
MRKVPVRGLAGCLPTAVRRTVLVTASAVLTTAIAASAQAAAIQTVFVIAMENHNWTQPPTQTSPQQIFGNSAAPYINSLVTSGNPNAAQVSYASNYLNAGVGIHPSEPNYIWSEAGSNLGVFNDNDPYQMPGGTVQTTPQSLSNYLQRTGTAWRSYQEDTDVNLVTNQPVSKSQYTVPLSSFSGTFTSGTNQYNGSNQYNYAAKHNPQVFFTSTNGGKQSYSEQSAGAKLCTLAATGNRSRQQYRFTIQLDHPGPVQRHAHEPDRRLHLPRCPLYP